MTAERVEEQVSPVLIKSEELAERLVGERTYLITEIGDFAAHVGVYHPSGIPPTTCHDCMIFMQHIFSAENIIKRIERDLASVNNALNSQV
jgi:hypothetical protein